MRKTGIKRQENLKVLSVAAIAGAVILGAPAYADNLPSLAGEGQDGVAAPLGTNSSDTSLLGGKSNTNSLSSDTSLLAEEGAAISSIPDNLLAMSDGDSSVILSGSEESQIPGNTPTLGDDSAYTLTETSENTDNSITLYEIKNQTATVTYTDQNGETQSYDYSTKVLNEKYYNLNYTSNVTLDANGSTNNRKNFTTAEDRPAINEHFVGVNRVVESGAAEGGAIYQMRGSINSITGDFIGNYISSSSNFYANGGAIMVYRTTIGDITGDFIGNYANAGTYASGGAIYNGSISTIGDITGNFIGNYANAGTYASGGAIFNFNN